MCIFRIDHAVAIAVIGASAASASLKLHALEIGREHFMPIFDGAGMVEVGDQETVLTCWPSR